MLVICNFTKHYGLKGKNWQAALTFLVLKPSYSFIMTENQSEIIRVLKTVFDPELEMNIYDLGLVYGIDVGINFQVHLIVTFTTPSCPFAEIILSEIHQKIESLSWVQSLSVEITFEPAWTSNMMSEEALLQAGLL